MHILPLNIKINKQAKDNWKNYDINFPDLIDYVNDDNDRNPYNWWPRLQKIMTDPQPDPIYTTDDR